MSKYRYKDSEYKKRLKKEAEKVAVKAEESNKESQKAGLIFLDESKPIEERLEAAKKIGSFTEKKNINKSLKIFKNKNHPEELRAYALSSIINQALSDESIKKETINALKEAEGAGKIATTALTFLQHTQFSAPTFYENNTAEYKDALRSIIDHNNKNLSSSALEILSLAKDEYTQRRLIESLEDAKNEIIEPEIAIQLLSYDLHADHFPVLRKIAKNPPNSAAKKEAIRNLGTDEKAKDILVNVIKDTEEDSETRHAAATALHCLHPEIATQHSKRIIIEEEGEHLNDLKTALLNTLIFLEKKPDKKENVLRGVSSSSNNFIDKLSNMKRSSKSAEYNQMIDLYLDMKKE